MKLIASDYDDTFYKDDESVNINKEYVDNFRNKGNYFVFATGRSFEDFMKKKDTYNLEYDYLIINHGATVLDKDNNVLFNNIIDDSVVSSIRECLDLDTAISYFCCQTYKSRMDFRDLNLTKINSKYSTSEECFKIVDILNKKFGDYIKAYYVNHNNVEVIKKGTNKKEAIKKLGEYLNINKKDIYTIGDSYSDMEMIEGFNGYAVRNAINELKEASIKVVDNVSDLIEDVM